MNCGAVTAGAEKMNRTCIVIGVKVSYKNDHKNCLICDFMHSDDRNISVGNSAVYILDRRLK